MAVMSRLHVEHGLNSRWTAVNIRRRIADDATIVLVASIDGVVEGFAIMNFDAHQAHLLLLAVAPESRRCGIGTALVSWLEDSCKSSGIDCVRLEVRVANKGAIEFYRKLGYAGTVTIDAYYDRDESALVMTHGLTGNCNSSDQA